VRADPVDSTEEAQSLANLAPLYGNKKIKRLSILDQFDSRDNRYGVKI
jgi:hypothetical protein